jgi:hypothetical protein
MENGEGRIAVPCQDIATVVAALSAGLGLEFENRESSYWGSYWSELPKGELRVVANRDPQYAAGRDPADEFYFESRFPEHPILVDTEGSPELRCRVTALLVSEFPGSVIVFPA